METTAVEQCSARIFIIKHTVHL